MEFLESIDAATWGVVAGGIAAIALVLFLKFIGGVAKIALVAAVLAGIAYKLCDAGIIKLH